MDTKVKNGRLGKKLPTAFMLSVIIFVLNYMTPDFSGDPPMLAAIKLAMARIVLPVFLIAILS